jgi:hypothetical protein
VPALVVSGVVSDLAAIKEGLTPTGFHKLADVPPLVSVVAG